MKKTAFIVALFLSAWGIAQETKGNRTIEYVVELDRLKFEKQELGVEKALSNMNGVRKCDVDALNYKLYVTVFEPAKGENIVDIDDIKIVLIDNGIEIKKYTQSVKIEQ